MVLVLRVQKGAVVPVRLTFREVRTDSLNGQLIQPTGCSVTIAKPDGTTQLSNASATWVQVGVFILYWDTTGLLPGDYKAQIRFGYAFSSAQGGASKTGEKDVILRLVVSI